MTSKQTPKELFEYRRQLLRDAQSWKKPDRIPFNVNVYNWMFLDAGYSVAKAGRDYNIIEDSMVKFAEKYKFDCFNVALSGFINTFAPYDSLGKNDAYNDKESVNINAVIGGYLKEDEFDFMISNYQKAVWEKVLFRRYPEAKNFTPKQFANAAKTMLDLGDAVTRINSRMREEFGIVNEQRLPCFSASYEYLWKYYVGMKNMSIALRRQPGKVKELVSVLNDYYLKKILPMLTEFEGPDPNEAYDGMADLLSTTMLNRKQFEQVWAPGIETFVKCAEEHNKQIFFFAEGSWERFGDFFDQFKKGTCCMMVEMDDPYAIRNKYSNLSLCCGLNVDTMGHATPEECVNMAHKAIDELGRDGGLILCPNKMLSFPYDMNSDNLKAVGDFVYGYKL